MQNRLQNNRIDKSEFSSREYILKRVLSCILTVAGFIFEFIDSFLI